MPVTKLMGQTITNLTRSETYRDKVVFTVDLHTDLEALRKVGGRGCWLGAAEAATLVTAGRRMAAHELLAALAATSKPCAFGGVSCCSRGSEPAWPCLPSPAPQVQAAATEHKNSKEHRSNFADDTSVNCNFQVGSGRCCNARRAGPAAAGKIQAA
jgi:hypothetical protein